MFPNNVQEFMTNILPYSLLKVIDEIHMLWQGKEKLALRDFLVLLLVRCRVVERALVWQKRYNPLYANIDINMAEMNSWGVLVYSIPFQIYRRLERNKLLVREKV